MKTALIVAMDSEGGIGKNNDLMWHLPKDMKFFKDTTQGQIVVMGRKNYDSIPEKYRPLPNRLNVVLTRNEHFNAPDCLVFHSLETCLKHFEEETERIVFIIGGGEIYRMALESDMLDEMYITHVHHRYEAETFFPRFDEENWESHVIFEQEIDAQHEAAFTVKKYTRKS
jgi:dihydrofolate reductase